MDIALDFVTKVNEQEFAIYTEGEVYRDGRDQPLRGTIAVIQVFQEETEVTEAITPALREILEERSMEKLYELYEEEYGHAMF